MEKKRALIILIAALALFALIFGSLYLAGVFKKNPPTAGLEATIENKREAVKSVIERTIAVDKDLDGVKDADEAKYKTDPNSPDSDGDGLLDGTELNIYRTDPLKTDSFNLGRDDEYWVRSRVILKGGEINRARYKDLTGK